MLRSRSLDLSFIRRRGRKRSAILGSVGQAFFRFFHLPFLTSFSWFFVVTPIALFSRLLS
jgi:hypothetical protein